MQPVPSVAETIVRAFVGPGDESVRDIDIYSTVEDIDSLLALVPASAVCRRYLLHGHGWRSDVIIHAHAADTASRGLEHGLLFVWRTQVIIDQP